MPDEPDGQKKRAVLGRLLEEPARFAYAGLCAISLAHLFPEKEQRDFCRKFVEDLVPWLDLSPTVIPAMEAFASGLGGEGTDTFTKVLLEDSVMKEKPTIITQDLVAFSLRYGYYDARSRVLISHVSWLLRVPPETIELSEESLMESLKESTEEPSESAQASRRKKESRRKLKRYLLIGLATVGGGTVIGLTGGLAAPLVAAGAATIIGSAGAAVLGSTAGIAIMASLFGAAGAGLTGYKMKKRVGAIEEFEFLPLTGGRQLHISIAITGWLSTGKYGSFAAPWHSLQHSTEQYCLAWESKYLMELGNALDAILNGLVNMVAQEALKYTILSGIVTALMWPASLITVASVIDNPWGVCLSRSAEVGKHLAHILLSRPQGHRPVTLIGFSLGARVIYFCLQELAQEAGSEGIIEDVVLLGAPVEGDVKRWKPLTRVVAGRIINGYCRGDWLLSFVYRSSSAKLNVAGLQPVGLDDRRMVNVDLSSVVNGHLDYMKQMDTLLKAVGIKTNECRYEEQSGLLRPLAGVAVHTPSERAAEKADSGEWSPWDWEPVSAAAQQNRTEPQNSPPGPPLSDRPAGHHRCTCVPSGEEDLLCTDCSNNNGKDSGSSAIRILGDPRKVPITTRCEPGPSPPLARRDRGANHIIALGMEFTLGLNFTQIREAADQIIRIDYLSFSAELTLSPGSASPPNASHPDIMYLLIPSTQHSPPAGKCALHRDSHGGRTLPSQSQDSSSDVTRCTSGGTSQSLYPDTCQHGAGTRLRTEMAVM
ncbi:PREDICTED: transmembrane and coiled-coil domain-containing protein 4 [Nanorana parkeri]|uniref:transmembrane and coiled-coil domain-containing protein 4 n=1 Tax=Nanorana parkeri TaxID=125878 RepID=UPI00085456C9|nr:PREDICTED: transmembrane and coiled-coil domain-containing protein 4 [Nanorana parkeri]